VDEYYQAIPITVNCGKLLPNVTDGLPVNVRVSADPLYSYWTRMLQNFIGDRDIVPPLPQRLGHISTVVWITKILPNHRAGSLLFGLGDTFSIDSCKLSYGSLVDSIGKSVVLETGIIREVPVPCNKDSYNFFYQSTFLYIYFSRICFCSSSLFSFFKLFSRFQSHNKKT